MNWLNLLGIAVGLAMDAFAVSIAAGLIIASVTSRHVFRCAFHFGLFQFLMPIVGWLAGSKLSPWVFTWGHGLAFGLLGVIGLKMLWDARSDKQDRDQADPTRGWLLVALSLGTSVDALAVGMSMGLMRVPVIFPSAVIGVVAALFSTVGITFASRALARYGRVAEGLGGVILILIGIRVLLFYW